MKKNGFTLVELISVLAILALLSLIVMPVMTYTINRSKEKAYVAQKNSIINAAQKYALDISSYLPTFDGNKYSITLKELKEKSYIEDEDIINPSNDKPMKGCVELTYKSKSKKYDYTYVEECKNYAQSPLLDEGMIPVILKNGKYYTVNDSEWYDYDKQLWANAAVVTKNSLKNYKNATTETEVLMNDIVGLFVWIPRFSYSIQTKNASGLTTYGYNATSKGGPGSVSIKFINQSTVDEGVAYFIGDVETNYRTHDAFYIDTNSNGIRETSEEVPGFWVAKFKTSATTNTLCSGVPTVENCKNISNSNIVIKPNYAMIIQQDIETQYQLSRNFSRANNIDLESKMESNSEYGALTYLTQSIYGKCTAKQTCGILSKNAVLVTGGGVNYAANTTYSSTSNWSGVYDLSLGAYERVLATYETPFNFDVSERNYDKYTGTTADTACSGEKCLGHGLSETENWHNVPSTPFLSATNPYMIRNSGTHNMFYYSNDLGLANNFTTFRIVLKAT